jgi:hypothetical protein
MSVAGEVFVAGITSLGDTGKYRRDFLRESVEGGWLDSTRITEFVGFAIGRVLTPNPILVNLGFQTLAFIGIYLLLKSLPSDKRKIIAVLVLLPSFNLWSSVASKEAILVFAVGILTAYVVDIYYNRDRIRPLQVFALAIIFVYKPHYLPGLLFLLGATKIVQKLERPLLLLSLIGLVSLLPLYLFRERLDDLSIQILPHFLGVGSSRDAFWVERYDVFWRAPYGMFQSFFGPTIPEFLLFRSPLVSFSFVESGVLLMLLLFLLVRRADSLPLVSLVVSGMSLFWLLFGNYPFGIMNSGTAIRYRAGYYLIVCVAVVLFFSATSYKRRRLQKKRS